MTNKAAALHAMIDQALTRAITMGKVSSFEVRIPYEDLTQDDSGSGEYADVMLKVEFEVSWESADDLILEEYSTDDLDSIFEEEE